jgi:hypothetical protein
MLVSSAWAVAVRALLEFAAAGSISNIREEIAAGARVLIDSRLNTKYKRQLRKWKTLDCRVQ